MFVECDPSATPAGAAWPRLSAGGRGAVGGSRPIADAKPVAERRPAQTRLSPDESRIHFISVPQLWLARNGGDLMRLCGCKQVGECELRLGRTWGAKFARRQGTIVIQLCERSPDANLICRRWGRPVACSPPPPRTGPATAQVSQTDSLRRRRTRTRQRASIWRRPIEMEEEMFVMTAARLRSLRTLCVK